MSNDPTDPFVAKWLSREELLALYPEKGYEATKLSYDNETIVVTGYDWGIDEQSMLTLIEIERKTGKMIVLDIQPMVIAKLPENSENLKQYIYDIEKAKLNVPECEIGEPKPNKGVRRQAIREQRKQMLKRNK